MRADAAAVERALTRARVPGAYLSGDEKPEVRICSGTACHASGAPALREAFRRELEALGLAGRVALVETGCHGFCQQGPVVVLRPQGLFYPRLSPEDVAEVVRASVGGGGAVERLLYRDPATGEPVAHERDIPFYALQERLVLAQNGRMDPCSLDDYLARGGYRSLAQVLAGSPEQVIDAVERSGLRGRGGAGFPTGRKWRACRSQPGDRRYVVCNADEGDPGAFMDRSLLEGNPHAVLEGMIIAGYAIGAEEGHVYVRREYPLAVERVRRAVEAARARGLLGRSVLDSPFAFEIRIHQGAGAFVCGESTALTASIEGRRGMPRGKHVRTVARGLYGRPTALNNVETFANVPWIVAHGAEAFAAIGTPTSRGTKIFSLTGKVANGGLVEVPMGTTLRRVIFEIGGGMLPGRTFKAVQLGGPSGGCVPAEHLDTPIDFDSLAALGSTMGSGGMVVVDDTTCLVDLARYFLAFTAEESCGKCGPCRIGTRRMLELLERVTAGTGTPRDLGRLEALAADVQEGSLCALGGSAPNPLLTTLRYFRSEYEAHVLDRVCPARVCRGLIRYRIDGEKCTGCRACAAVCPAKAVAGPRKKPQSIDPERCLRCDACRQACPVGAVSVESPGGGPPDVH